jgi:hypothetical protein
MYRRQSICKPAESYQKICQEGLAHIESVRKEGKKFWRIGGFRISHNLSDVLDRPGDMVQILYRIQVYLGQMVQETFYGRGQSVCCWRFVVSANGHKEQGDQLETAI